MDILHRHNVFVDTFRKKDVEGTHFLSHSHSDHFHNKLRQGGFKHKVYCSRTTAFLLGPLVNCYPLSTRKIHSINNLQVRVLKTFHSPGSRGFFFPQLHVLFLGDTRLTHKIYKFIAETKPKHILVDFLHGNWIHPMPTPKNSFKLCVQALVFLAQKHKQIFICFPHTGFVLFWKKLKLSCKLDRKTLSPDVIKLLLPFEDNNARLVAVGLKAAKIHLLPSTLAFAVGQCDSDKIAVMENGETLRVCVSFHASKEEYEHLQAITDARLESIETRRVP